MDITTQTTSEDPDRELMKEEMSASSVLVEAMVSVAPCVRVGSGMKLAAILCSTSTRRLAMATELVIPKMATDTILEQQLVRGIYSAMTMATRSDSRIQATGKLESIETDYIPESLHWPKCIFIYLQT